MPWQLFTFISVVSLSISVILQRILLHKHKVDPFAYAVIFQGIVGLLLMTFAIVHGFSLPNFEPLIIPAFVSLICFGVGHIFYAKTLQQVEASSFSVLFATQAVWTMLLGIVLLGESMTVLQIIGTICIFGSVAMLAKNIRSIFHERGTILGIITGLLFGIAIYYWSFVGRNTDSISWAAISFFGTALVILLIRPRAIQSMKPFLKSETFSKLWLLALFYGIGSLTMMFAYKLGSFAVVSPLRQTSIIVTVLLALSFLPAERNRIGKKLAAAAVCTLGVLLIVI